MWWFKKLNCLFLFLLLGCSPILTSFPEGVQTQFKKVFVRVIEDRRGQYMRLQLIKKMQSNTHAPYHCFLEVSLQTHKSILALSEEGVAVRDRLTTTATYRLLNKDEETLTSGTLTAHGSYNLIEDEFFAVTSAQKMAEEANIDRLTNTLLLAVAFYFKEHPQT